MHLRSVRSQHVELILRGLRRGEEHEARGPGTEKAAIRPELQARGDGDLGRVGREAAGLPGEAQCIRLDGEPGVFIVQCATSDHDRVGASPRSWSTRSLSRRRGDRGAAALDGIDLAIRVAATLMKTKGRDI